MKESMFLIYLYKRGK